MFKHHEKWLLICFDKLIYLENSVRSRDFQVLVGEQRDVHLAESSLLSGGVDPGEMGEMGICGARDDFATDFAEFLGTLGESDDFGWADKGEVQGVEEDDHVFALEIVRNV